MGELDRRPGILGVVVVLLVTLAVPFLGSPASAFGERVFDSNTVIGSDPSFLVYANQSVAQSFRASAAYVLQNVSLRLRNLGATTDTVNITIQTNVGGVPSGTLLAWSTPITGGAVGPVSAPLTPNPVLAQGTTYWIVAKKSGLATDAYEWHHSNGNVYAGGKAMLNTGVGWTNPGSATDLWFLTYGRQLETNMTLAMTVSPARVLAKGFVNLTVYLNGTGERSAPSAWVNMTLPAGLTYFSDTANLVPSSTPFPNFTFANVGNGPHSFLVTARVDPAVAPYSVLTSGVTLVFTNSAGVRQPPASAQASIVVGLQSKQLYLVPGNPAPPQGLTPVPPVGPQVVFTITRGGAAVDFQLTTPLARPFRALSLSAFLYIDSRSHSPRNEDLNLTLFEVNGAMQTPVAYEQLRYATDNINGFQLFSYPFPQLDHNFSAGHQVMVRVRNMASGQDDALLATNATATRSRLEILSSTYVRTDGLEFRDARGPATVWSPLDSLVVRANVSDPFGTTEIAGAWVNLTDPWGNRVIVLAAMTPIATDPSNPSVWRLFEFTYGPSLVNGTYRVEVMAVERNGVQAFATGSALVRAPAISLVMVPSQPAALSGDTFFYEIWYNNTGTGSASSAWINLTLPGEVTFVTSSAEANRTGTTNWTFFGLTPGNSLLLAEVKVRSPLPPAPFIRAAVSLTFSDEKGFLWARQTVFADVILQGPVVSLSVTPSSATIHPNEAFVFSVVLANSGDASRDLWLNVTVPFLLTFISDTSASLGGTSVPTAGGIGIRLSSMPGGTTWTIDVTVRSGAGLGRGSVLSVTAGLNYTNARGTIMPPTAGMASVVVVAPLMANASVRIASSLAVPGDIVATVLNFTNVGDESAKSVWANLTVDPHFSLASASMAVSVSGTSVRFALSNVAIGSTFIFLNFTVSPATPDAAVLAILGSIAYTDRLGNPMVSIAAIPSNVTVSAPVLTVTGAPTDLIVQSGTTITYGVTPSNAGTGTAGDVWLNLTLPADLFYVADTSSGVRTIVGQDIHWHWQGFAPGSKPFDLTLEARPSAMDNSTLDVVLRLQSTDANGNLRPDATATVLAHVIAPRIELTLTASQDHVPTETAFYYTLRIRNVGTTMAKTVFLLESLNSRLSLDSYNSNVPATGAPDLNWTFHQLQPGELQVITLFVRIPVGTPVGSVVPNAIAAVFSNSEGTMAGYTQSDTVLVTVEEGFSIAPIAAVAAAIAGVLIGFLVYRKRQSRIEEVFMITKDGILIDHLTRSLVDDKDPDIVSGMLTGVQQFARDAFRYGEDRSLHEMQFGDHRVLIERGDWIFLASVCSHGNAQMIGRKLRKVIADIESNYGEVLKFWDGNMDRMAGAREIIRDSLLG